MADLIEIYNRLVIALRSDADEVSRSFFHPEFSVHEDPGMPYGGVYEGADGFINLRKKVKEYWSLEILSRCAEPDGNYLVIVLKLVGLPEASTAGLETMVTVVWTFEGDKALRAQVLYYNTPLLAAAIAPAV